MNDFDLRHARDAFHSFDNSAFSTSHEYGNPSQGSIDLTDFNSFADLHESDLGPSHDPIDDIYQFPLDLSSAINPPPVYLDNFFDPATHVLPFIQPEEIKVSRVVAGECDPVSFNRLLPSKPVIRVFKGKQQLKRKWTSTRSKTQKVQEVVDVKPTREPSPSESLSNESNIPGYFVMRPDGHHENKRQRSQLSPLARMNTAAVRQRGACFKCRMWRKKCDLGSPCQNCVDDPARRIDPTTIFSQPCFRLDLDQCGFFRKKSALWNKPLRDSMKWVSRAEIVLSIQPGSLRDLDCPAFDVICSHYQPEPDDIIQRKYGPRRDQTLIIPCYCAVNTRRLKEQIPNITEKHLNYLLNRYEQGYEYVPPIILHALKIAQIHESYDPLLKIALKLWVSSRFLAAPRSLRGEEKLGLEPVRESDAHDRGYIPLPPMLDYQIDTMTIRWLTEQTDRLLKGMWKKLSKRDKGDWFTMFLTIFLLLHNLEGVYQAQLTFIQEHGGSDFGQLIEHFSASMLDQWQWTHKHLLFVFRYYIRRCALDGRPIFTEECFEECANSAQMGHQEQGFYNELISWRQDIIEQHNADDDAIATSEFSSISWCSQLLFTDLEDTNG